MAYSYPGYGWKTRIQPASFRGVKFHVKNTDTNVGRRNVLHQFPFREDAFSEDLGNDADEFTVRGFVIQKGSNNFDHFDERDALIKALRTSGSGKLIHPFLGEFNVSVRGKATITESFREGGMARFKMVFVKVRKSVTVTSVVPINDIAEMDKAAKKGVEGLKDKFHGMRSKLDKLKSAYYAKGRLVERVSTAFQMIEGTFSGVRGIASSTLSMFRNAIDSALDQITDTVNSACLLADLVLDTIDDPLAMIGIPTPIVRSFLGACTGQAEAPAIQLPGGGIPRDLGKSMVNGFTGMEKFGESEDDVQTSLTTGYSSTEDRNPDASLYGGRLDDITVSNTNTAAEAVDTLYIVNMVRAGCLMNATRVAVRTNLGSYEESKKMMTDITDAIDTLIEKMANESADTTYSDYNISIDNTGYYNVMEDIRATFVKVMAARGATLAKKEEYKIPPIVLPTIALAYDKYDDVTRDAEIFERNRNETIHPGFLPQGEEIDILNE